MENDSDAAARPTFRIHWRASCDAKPHGRGFQIHRTHESRVRQAGACWEGGLIPPRCHFGRRRLRLEGEVDYSPRAAWMTPRPSPYGHGLAESMLRWTLATLYNEPDQRGEIDYRPEPRNMRVEVRVYALQEAAE